MMTDSYMPKSFFMVLFEHMKLEVDWVTEYWRRELLMQNNPWSAVQSVRISIQVLHEKSPQCGRRQCEHTLLHPAVDEVALTFFTFFLIRTDGLTNGNCRV
jgi:hypothetical protein